MTEIRTYFGCYITQRVDSSTIPFFIFEARAKDIRQWAGIRRTAEVPQGTQRVLRPARQHAIAKFVGAESTNTIPNNILLAFDPGKATFRSMKERLEECILPAQLENGCANQI